jgi:hypothetical protein
MSYAMALHLNRAAVTRIVLAGSVWGLALSAGFFAIAVAQCGLPCPDDIAVTTAVCIGTGILTVGPVAAFGSRL